MNNRTWFFFLFFVFCFLFLFSGGFFSFVHFFHFSFVAAFNLSCFRFFPSFFHHHDTLNLLMLRM